MAKVFNCLGIVQLKGSDECHIKFTENLKQRLDKFKPFENWQRLDFVEFDNSFTKQDLLMLAIENQKFKSPTDQMLLNKELHKMAKKAKQVIRHKTLTTGIE